MVSSPPLFSRLRSLVFSHVFGIILFVYAFLPLFWFKSDYIFRTEEVSYLNYSYVVDKFGSLWNESLNNGQPANFYSLLAVFPNGWYYKILSELGLPLFLIQRSFLVLVQMAIIFSIFKLTHFLTRQKSVAFLSVFFYTLTFYSLSTPLYTSKMFQLILMPLLSYFYIRYLETKAAKYIFLNIAALYLFKAVFINPPTAVVTLAVYPVLTIIYYRSFNFRRQLVFFLPVSFLIAEVSFLYYSFVKFSTTGASRVFQNSAIFLQSNLMDLFRLFHGAWWENNNVYNKSKWFYDLLPIKSIAYFFFALLFLGLVTRKRERRVRHALWLSALFLAFFLAAGSGGPLGEFYRDLYHKFSWAVIFREPWAKFASLALYFGTICFAYSLLLLRRWRSYLYPVILFLLLVHGYPFFSGKVIDHQASGRGNIDVKIPDYWFKIGEWSKSHSQENILALPVPRNPVNYPYYQWYEAGVGNFGGSLTEMFLRSRIVTTTNFPYPAQIYLLGNYNPQTLSLFNLDYVLEQKDVAGFDSDSTISLNDLKRDHFVSEDPVATFGKLEVYRVNESFRMPLFFVPKKIVLHSGTDGNDAEVLEELPNLSTETALIDSSDQDDPTSLLVSSSALLSLPIPKDGVWALPHRDVSHDPFLRERLSEIDRLLDLGDYGTAIEALARYPENSRRDIRYLVRMMRVVSSKFRFPWAEKELALGCTQYCFQVTVPKESSYEIKFKIPGYLRVGGERVRLYQVESRVRNLVGEYSLTELASRTMTLPRGNFYLVLSLKKEEAVRSDSEWNEPRTLKESEGKRNLTYLGPGEAWASESEKLKDDSIRYRLLTDWPGNREYRISLDYSANSAPFELAVMEADQNGKKNLTFLDGVVGYPTEKGLHYEAFVHSSEKPKSAAIFLLPLSGYKFSDIRVLNLSVSPQYLPKVLLKSEREREAKGSEPKINYEKRKPTLYSLEITEANTPLNLVFLQGYSPGWRLKNKSTGKTVPESRHNVANLHLNSWYLRSEDFNGLSQGEFILEYFPQAIYDRLSLMTKMSGLFFFFWSVRFFRERTTRARRRLVQAFYDAIVKLKSFVLFS